MKRHGEIWQQGMEKNRIQAKEQNEQHFFLLVIMLIVLVAYLLLSLLATVCRNDFH
jgi:hypothetical protein